MHPLPAAPRNVRLRTALGTWSGAGLAGMALLVGGAVYLGFEMARDDFRMPRRDWQLDAAHKLVNIMGEVGPYAEPLHAADRVHRFHYGFTREGGQPQMGTAWVRWPMLPGPGDSVTVEYLPSDPTVHRVRGSKSTLAALILPGLAGGVLLPGLFLAGWWLVRSYQTYYVLRHGRATTARLTGPRQLISKLGQLQVHYAFADQHGIPRKASQWVGQGGALGRIVLAAEAGQDLPGAMVIHREDRPNKARLVVTEDVSEADR